MNSRERRACRIQSFYTHRDKAFTRGATDIDADANTVGTALTRLKQRDLVRHKNGYWALVEDVDRVTAAYELQTVSERLDAEDGGIDPAEWDAVAPDRPHPSESSGGD